MSGGSDDFGFYNFATDTVKCYPAGRIAPVSRNMIDDVPVVPATASAIGVDWLPDKTRNTISKVERDYRRYSGIIDNDAGQQADVPADVMDDYNGNFAQVGPLKVG